MTTEHAPAIRFIDYMGDADDYNKVLLIGPYPDDTARNRDLARLNDLPLGSPEHHGGAEFIPATMAQARTGFDGQTVPPEQVAKAASVREFFAAYYRFPLDDEEELPAELPGQIPAFASPEGGPTHA